MPYGQCRTELWSWKTVKRLKQEAARIFLSIRSRHIRENWLLPQSEQTRRSTAFDFFSDDQMPVLSLRILILKTVDGSLLQRQKSFLRAKPWPFAEARMHKKLKAQFDTNISSELLWIVRSGIFILSETGTICKHYKNCRYYQVSALKNLEKTSFALPLIVSQGNFSADRAKCGIKQKAENNDLKKLNKLPLVDASCINHSALRSSSPKLRKPYGWASMSTSICWRRRSNHKKRYSKSIFVSVEPKKHQAADVIFPCHKFFRNPFSLSCRKCLEVRLAVRKTKQV